MYLIRQFYSKMIAFYLHFFTIYPFFSDCFKKNMQTIQKDAFEENKSTGPEPSTEPQLPQVDPSLIFPTPSPPEYHEERYRWVIIALVSVAFTINNLANNAIIPISSKVSKIYDLSETYANLPIQVSFLINPIMNFTAGSFIDSKGLGISFRIGAILYAVGLLGFCLINYGYHWVLIGAILIALGQPLVMNCPAKVATYWFIDKNRTVATGIISAINLVTLGVSLVFPAIFVQQQAMGDDAKNQIFNLYSKYFIAAVVNGLLIMFLMKEKPQKLPSAGAEQQKTTLTKTWEIIKGDKNIWKFFIASILMYGTFLSFGSTSNMLFKPYGFQDTQIAIFGVCLLVSGVLGSVSYTVYIKKTIKYKNAIVCACVLALAFIVTNALLMNFATEQRILISFMILGMGFNLIPMVPISYDLGCELSFPVGEAQVVGIVTGGAMIYTVVLTLTITAAVGFGSPKQSAICMLIYIILFLIGGVLYCLVDINLKRRQHEKRHHEKHKSVDNTEYGLNVGDSGKEGNLKKPLTGKRRSQSEQILTISEVFQDSLITDNKSQGYNEPEVQVGASSPDKFASKHKLSFDQTIPQPKPFKIEPKNKTPRGSSRHSSRHSNKQQNQI